MKIGLIGSGPETLPLMQFLTHDDHEYHIFWDWKFWPRGDKSPQLGQQRCLVGRDYLIALGVDALIVPPLYEHISSEIPIVPLFAKYLNDYCLKFSLVGKLGLLCDYQQADLSQEIVSGIAKQYTLSSAQYNTKQFHKDFPVRAKEMRMWKYFLTTYGKKDWMVRKTIKTDLRYFQDAAVDTLIPMSWGQLFYQSMITQRTNRKRLRFHGLDAVESCRQDLSQNLALEQSTYSITLHTTDTAIGPIADEKKRQSVLSKGGSVTIGIENVI